MTSPERPGPVPGPSTEVGMATLTFPCPSCGGRMAVGPALAGRVVRCPHCKQVATAPALVGVPLPDTNHSPAPLTDLGIDPPTVVAGGSNPPPDTTPDRPPRPSAPLEGADSILADPDLDDDSVLGFVEVRKLTLPPPLGPPPAAEPVPVPGPTPVVFPVPVRPADSATVGPPEPVYTPVPLPTRPVTPAPANGVNPWAGFDAASLPTPVVQMPALPAVPRHSAPVRAGVSTWVAGLLLAWAVIATAFAVWGWLRDGGHPPATPPAKPPQGRAGLR